MLTPDAGPEALRRSGSTHQPPPLPRQLSHHHSRPPAAVFFLSIPTHKNLPATHRPRALNPSHSARRLLNHQSQSCTTRMTTVCRGDAGPSLMSSSLHQAISCHGVAQNRAGRKGETHAITDQLRPRPARAHHQAQLRSQRRRLRAIHHLPTARVVVTLATHRASPRTSTRVASNKKAPATRRGSHFVTSLLRHFVTSLPRHFVTASLRHFFFKMLIASVYRWASCTSAGVKR